MIRLVHLMRRKTGLSKAEFCRRLRDDFGPLVASHQVDLDLVRYVQLHPDRLDRGLDLQAREDRNMANGDIDAVAEYWWASSASFCAALQSERGRSAATSLARAEARLLDTETSLAWPAVEYPQVANCLVRPVAKSRCGIMRLLFAFRPLAHLSDETARYYWLHTHGPLIRSHSASRGLIAYNQVHRVENAEFCAWHAVQNDRQRPYLGYAESWFDRLSMPSGPECEAAKSAALDDERHFIDWTTAVLLIGKELVFVDRDWF
jgi:hypothetical protein